MHPNLHESDEIDYNLYPALFQVFAIILIGYLSGTFEIITRDQVQGLNKFVSTFSLPCLLFKNLAVVQFSSVNWLFLTSIFVSKTLIFILALAVTLFVLRPINIGLAAVFAIFVSQSNDFALGYPILEAVYEKTHPDYLDYIYLLAPISLVILNPIAFLLMEANEILTERRNRKKNNCLAIDSETSEVESDSKESDELDSIKVIKPSTSEQIKTPKKQLTSSDLIKSTIWSTVSNPIVFMTVVALIANVILKQHIPRILDPIITALANSFSALALFYLGYTMVGKIKNLTFSTIVIILILVLTKGLIYPLINREAIIHLNENFNFNQPNNSDVDSLSSFGFLYGTFPTAPSLFVYTSRYKSLPEDLISAALVFGTIASAPLMMISGKMISLKYNASSVSNFEDIACKTAYGFSFLTWFCCIWVLYVFLASGRVFKKPYLFTFYLILSQMLTALIHVIWSNVTTNVANLDPVYGLIHIGFGVFAEFLTRCLPLSIMLSIISISRMHKINKNRLLMILVKVADSDLFLYFIGFGLPLITTIVCLLIGDIPQKQSMIIQLGKSQMIVSNVFLLLIIIFTFCCLLVFVRAKNENNSFFMSANSSKRKSSTDSQQTLNRNSVSEIDIESELEDSKLTYGNTKIELSEYDLELLNEENQIMQHLSLVVILSFNSLMSLFFELWLLFDENKSGIFYELQLIDTTLLFGQGFFTLLSFGFDNQYIFAPMTFKMKEIFGLIEPFKLPDLDDLPQETIDMCKKFELKYKSKCANKIVKDLRFHHKFYRSVFKGSDLIDWLIKKNLADTRAKGEEIGKKLVEGQIISHVTHKRHFYDGYHLYKFSF